MPVKTKILERPRGKGTLLRGDAIVTEAPYDLTLSQTIHVVSTLDGHTEEVEGLREVTGALRMEPFLAVSLAGEELVLQLEDGRRLPIFIINNRGKIAARGWFEEG